MFYGEGLLVPRPTRKLEDHPLSALCNCLFSIFAATLRNRRTSLHPQPEDAPCRCDKGPTLHVIADTRLVNRFYDAMRLIFFYTHVLIYDPFLLAMICWMCNPRTGCIADLRSCRRLDKMAEFDTWRAACSITTGCSSECT
jgi:hypothetical protein